MSCAPGPCPDYLASAGQLPHVRRRTCPVCWQADQTQPTKVQQAEHQPKEPDFGLKPTRDPTKRRRYREGSTRVPQSQWVAPRLTNRPRKGSR